MKTAAFLYGEREREREGIIFLGNTFVGNGTQIGASWSHGHP